MSNKADFTTYYIETNIDVFRINVPHDWDVNMHPSSNGWATVEFKEGDKVRLAFNTVKSIKSSAVQMQRMRPNLNSEMTEIESFTWIDVVNEDVSNINTRYDMVETRRVELRAEARRDGNTPERTTELDEEEF